MEEGAQAVVEKKQHSVMLTVEQSEQISALAESERRTFNEMVRVGLDEWLNARAGKRTSASRRQVIFKLYDEQAFSYRNATCEYDGSKDRLDVCRGERLIASFDASSVEFWDGGEENDEA